MEDELTTALAGVRDAFARYPRRSVLDGHLAEMAARLNFAKPKRRDEEAEWIPSRRTPSSSRCPNWCQLVSTVAG
ncbi:hypothetical protein [Micromonospora saelicesensis]|uniref:hypothetical protein n=1 Tax=Micromonospora saelicesensis TaxID=285676 RepID=UPI0011BD9CA3|nr:hypothetical protein [Micromonospora saelicesensis]